MSQHELVCWLDELFVKRKKINKQTNKKDNTVEETKKENTVEEKKKENLSKPDRNNLFTNYLHPHPLDINNSYIVI